VVERAASSEGGYEETRSRLEVVGRDLRSRIMAQLRHRGNSNSFPCAACAIEDGVTRYQHDRTQVPSAQSPPGPAR
jgi:hypothetical protein